MACLCCVQNEDCSRCGDPNEELVCPSCEGWKWLDDGNGGTGSCYLCKSNGTLTRAAIVDFYSPEFLTEMIDKAEKLSLPENEGWRLRPDAKGEGR